MPCLSLIDILYSIVAVHPKVVRSSVLAFSSVVPVLEAGILIRHEISNLAPD